MNDGRYQITERRNGATPSNDDPKAQALKRHSGVFDLRDTKSGNVIVATGADLRKVRAIQARWNSLIIPAM
jgi:hypothetical protein